MTTCRQNDIFHTFGFYSTGTGTNMEDLIKMSDEGELVVDMFHHQKQVDGEAYRLLVVGRERGAYSPSPMTDGWNWNWLAHSKAT